MKFKRKWKFRVFKSRLRKRLLQLFGDNAKGILVKGQDGYFVLDPSDSHISKQLLQTGSYNPHETKEILKYVNTETKILIIGGHIGTLVVPLAKIAKEVSVVEANPTTFELLNLNLKLNDLSNVRLFNLAASDQSGKLEFVKNTENSGGSKRLPAQRRDNYFYDNPEVVEIDAASMDQVFPSDHFDIILMDIEGSEYFAIKGMPNLIKRCKTLIFEFFPDHLRYVSGVSALEFYEIIPKNTFTQAFLPKQNRKCSFDDLKKELDNLDKNNASEDGIFLFK